jgi:putative ABC transport system permease protein
MLIWRLAFRNLFRHKSRFFMNMFLLIGAFSAIVLFKGFREYVLETVRDLMVETQYGHIQVAKPTFWDHTPVERDTDRMIEDPQQYIEKIRQIPNVQSVSPRVIFYGLVNTENQSLPTRLVGIQPEVESRMQRRLFFSEGTGFKESKKGIISSGLQKILKVKPGEDVTVVSPTLDGSVNAMDFQITGTFKTGFVEFDKATVYIPVQDAQKLFSSDHVDNLVIFLKNPASLNETLLEIQKTLKGTSLKARAWTELTELYSQVEAFYNFQNFFVECILLVLLILSISNTVTMTAFERLGEIGTLRALGDQEKDIRLMMLAESLLLAVLAIVIGFPVSYLLIKTFDVLQLPITLPMATVPIPMKMLSHEDAYVEASVVCFLSVVLASLWPAKKITRIPIVTALRAKI